jgi:hypothetical protein
MISVADETAVAESTKPRRRPVSRSTKPQVASKVKVGLYISPESARRLGATALMEGKDRSDLVDELIRQHLRRWVVVDRGGAPGPTLPVTEDRQDTAA